MSLASQQATFRSKLTHEVHHEADHSNDSVISGYCQPI